MTPLNTPEPVVVPPETAAVNPGPVIADPNAVVTPAAPAPAALGARAQAVAAGYAVAERFQDDATFLQTLMNAATQGEQYRQQLLAAQNAPVAQPVAPAAPAAAAPKPWQAPEWNPQWESLVVRGADGTASLVPGADPAILPKFHAFQAHRKAFADKLVMDPEAVLGPMIDARAKALAEQQVKEAIATRDQTTYVEQFVAQNSSWLHQQGVDGRPVLNHQGQPVLSPAGVRFKTHLNTAQSLGIADIRGQEAYARTALQNDYLQAQQGQAAAAATSNAQTLAGNRRQPNAAGTMPHPGQPGVQPPPSGDLRAMLAHAMAANGITDANLGFGG